MYAFRTLFGCFITKPPYFSTCVSYSILYTFGHSEIQFLNLKFEDLERPKKKYF